MPIYEYKVVILELEVELQQRQINQLALAGWRLPTEQAIALRTLNDQ